MPKIKSKSPKKFLLVLVVTLLIVLALAMGLYLQRKSSKHTPYTGPIENLRVGNVGEYTIFNLVAKDRNIFEDNGLNVQIKEYSSGPASLMGMFAGETDINVAADFVGVRNIFEHPEIRILAQVNQHRVFQLAVLKDKVANINDLRGKTIGVTKNSAGEYFLGNFLGDNDIDLSEINMKDMAAPDMLSQLEKGQIDGFVVFEPHIYNAKKKLENKLQLWDIQGDQNLSALLYTTESYLKKNPQIVERYLRSLVTAESYVLSNPIPAKEFLSKKLNYDRAYVEYSWPRFTHNISLNQELILSMENQARWTIKNNLTTKKQVPNYLNFIYFDALLKVKPNAITIIR